MQVSLLTTTALATTIVYQRFDHRELSETRTLALIALRVADISGQEIMFEDCTQQNLKEWWYGTCQKCRDSVCVDMPNFVDAKGYDCTDWIGSDCTDKYGAQEGYTPSQMSDVRNSCPLSCAASCVKLRAKQWYRTCQKCRESKCVDMPNFVDAKGYDCTDWIGSDCTDKYRAEEGYTSPQMSDVRNSCPLICAMSCVNIIANQWYGTCRKCRDSV